MSKATGAKGDAQVQVELLTTEDMAALLRTTPESIRKSHERGLLPQAARIPGVRGHRWLKTTVEAWLLQKFEKGAA